MAIKISALTAASAANVAMQFEVNDGGASRKLTLAQMFALSMAAVTVDTPLLNMAQTWNSGPITFTAWKLNITDSASNNASKLLDLQINGSSKFSVSKAGNAVAVTLQTTGIANLNSVNVGNGWYFMSQGSSGGLGFGSGHKLGWKSTATTNTDATTDTNLVCDGAGIIAQRNGTNAQEFRLYGTFTDASNYERGFWRYSAGNSAYELGSEQAGTGGARNVRLLRDGVEHVALNGAVQLGRNLIFSTDNTYDLGASGANRPRTGYFGTSLVVGTNQVLATRATGWAAATGVATRTTFATGSVTLSQLAEHVKALVDDLTTHGLIGA